MLSILVGMGQPDWTSSELPSVFKILEQSIMGWLGERQWASCIVASLIRRQAGARIRYLRKLYQYGAKLSYRTLSKQSKQCDQRWNYQSMELSLNARRSMHRTCGLDIDTMYW
jgi:hypothetical protein